MSSIVTNHLNDNKKLIADELVEEILTKSQIKFPEEEIARGRKYFEEFFGFLAQSLLNENQETNAELVNWAKQNGAIEANLGNNLSRILNTYNYIRDSFLDKIYGICSYYNLSADDTFKVIKKLNKFIDVALHETIRSFDSFKDKLLKITKDEVNELSAPIVPLEEGTAVLPIIGQVDSYRAKYILEKIVPKVAELNVQQLIIDFSGILAVDTMVVDHLFKINRVLTLLGIKSTITGIRPEVARTTVQLGIDLSSLETSATVEQALKRIRENRGK